MNRPIIRFLISAIICTVFFGCGDKSPDENGAEKYAVEREFRKTGAPATVRVKISDESLTVADLLTFVIEIEQGQRVKAQLPELSDLDFGQFLVRDHRIIPESLSEDGTSTLGISCTLEPQLSGKYIIEPFEVRFTVEGERPESDADSTVHTIKTEPFTIEVKSVSADDLSKAEIRPIQGPVDLPKKGIDRKKLIFLIAVTVAAIVLILVVILVGRKWKVGEVGRKISPHKAALEALRRLHRKKLIEQGLIKEFYYEISTIMRHYIEGRFGLAAPEQTTDEFLASISRDGHFDSRTQELLGSFLEHCDMVKFARHAPETAEIQRTFNITRDFIEETKPEEKNGI